MRKSTAAQLISEIKFRQTGYEPGNLRLPPHQNSGDVQEAQYRRDLFLGVPSTFGGTLDLDNAGFSWNS